MVGPLFSSIVVRELAIKAGCLVETCDSAKRVRKNIPSKETANVKTLMKNKLGIC
jgi:hypothetical protein